MKKETLEVKEVPVKTKKKSGGFQSPKGMHDILLPETLVLEKFRRTAKEVAEFYGFEEIQTPALEQEELFAKGVGLATNIVEKEMYTLRTKGGDRLALRPEGTAPVVRAYIQHGMASLPQPVKLWYFEPMFRHESPQAGRFREFRQFGLECFGEEHPATDVEIMQVTTKILEAFGLKHFYLEVNSIGCTKCRPIYKNALKAYYRNRISRLCPDCKRRIKENPLRLLDCQNEVCVVIKEGAPEIVEHVCQECRAHFKTVLEFLDDVGIPYTLNPHLVRGLDYYNRTVFEVIPTNNKDDIGSGRTGTPVKSIGGGGRYDYLVELLGGAPTPGVGVALGVERTIAIWRDQGGKMPLSAQPKAFLAQLGDLAKRKTLKVLEEFRKADILVATSLGRDSMKAQLKVADRLGTPYTLILGQKEAFDGNIILRDMHSGLQETLPLEKIVEELKERLREK
ncbi:MAG: histidine--tRNA ligase [Parcubacteria group bacterium]|nr:histidine--tRNA ligase [Parcubacteria group bacterium]